MGHGKENNERGSEMNHDRDGKTYDESDPQCYRCNCFIKVKEIYCRDCIRPLIAPTYTPSVIGFKVEFEKGTDRDKPLLICHINYQDKTMTFRNRG